MDSGRFSSFGCGNMDRGQVYTLEGVIAGLLVLLSLLLVLQSLAVTPQAVGGQDVIDQRETLAQDALQSMNDSTIRAAVLYWNTSTESFHCTPGGEEFYPGYADRSCKLPHADAAPPNDFGATLEQSLDGPYNVYIAYNESGDVARNRSVYQGQPGSGSVRVSRSIVVFEDDPIIAQNGTASGTTVSDASEFYAPNVTSDSDVYNVFHVEVVTWGS